VMDSTRAFPPRDPSSADRTSPERNWPQCEQSPSPLVSDYAADRRHTRLPFSRPGRPGHEDPCFVTVDRSFAFLRTEIHGG
jgi:hypothetical protein